VKFVSFVKFVAKKIWKFTKTVIIMLLNPKFLLCFGLGWIITNGWAYVLLGVGMWLGIDWMIFVASGYLALLWVPGTPEKVITFVLAIFFLKLFFPNDEKTLGVLKEMLASEKLKNAKEKINKKKQKLVKKYKKRVNERRRVMYETVILGSGYFSVGYAYAHQNTLIIEETQLADPHFFGTLEGFDADFVKPTSQGAAELYGSFEKDGVLKEGRLAVNELEPALCRFIKNTQPEILLGSFCTEVKKTQKGYNVTLCNNEGIRVVSTRRVIDTRQREGKKINLLLALKDGQIPRLDNVLPSFYEGQKIWKVYFEDECDVNEAKSRILDVYGDRLRECGARIIATSYRMIDDSNPEPCEDAQGIWKVCERSFGNPFAAFEKGELWK